MSDIVKMNIDGSKKTIRLNIVNATTGIGMDVKTGGGSSKTIKQIYKGPDKPTDPNILIWIDTSIPPITGTQLITSDNLEFITVDNDIFILNEQSSQSLLTIDNKEFIEANDKKFILKEEY